MMDRRNFLQITTASALTSMLMLGGCQNPFADNQNQEETLSFQENGTLRLTLAAYPNTFDPTIASRATEYSIGYLLFNGLIWLDDKLEPQPDLAESWTHTDDLLSWTFKLRQNAQFHHNNTPLTAKDVVYTFKRILDVETISPLRSSLKFIKGVKALEDHTVRFTLETPSLDFLLLLNAPQAKIIPEEYDPELLAREPSGTGPFKFDTYTQGELLILKQNLDYWNSDAFYIQTVEYHYIPSQEQQALELAHNKVDVILDASFGQLEGLAEYPDVIIKDVLSGFYSTIVMRATEPPFDNPLVREALKYCLDRKVLVDTLLHGLGEVGNDHPIVSFSDYWNDLPQRPYDPDHAKELLAQAGYPDGLTLDLITSEVSPGMVRLAESFSQMAAKAGVTIIVTSISSDIYGSDYWNQHPPFFMGNWGFRPSISETFMVAYHSESHWNEARWHTPELDELLITAQAEPDKNRRIELYHEAQRIIHDEGAVIIPYFRPLLIATHKSVYNLKPYLTGRLNLENVRLVAEEN